jgi:hypothetical protein
MLVQKSTSSLHFPAGLKMGGCDCLAEINSSTNQPLHPLRIEQASGTVAAAASPHETPLATTLENENKKFV